MQKHAIMDMSQAVGHVVLDKTVIPLVQAVIEGRWGLLSIYDTRRLSDSTGISDRYRGYRGYRG